LTDTKSSSRHGWHQLQLPAYELSYFDGIATEGSEIVGDSPQIQTGGSNIVENRAAKKQKYTRRMKS
jgi:hypothetical protein